MRWEFWDFGWLNSSFIHLLCNSSSKKNVHVSDKASKVPKLVQIQMDINGHDSAYESIL